MDQFYGLFWVTLITNIRSTLLWLLSKVKGLHFCVPSPFQHLTFQIWWFYIFCKPLLNNMESIFHCSVIFLLRLIQTNLAPFCHFVHEWSLGLCCSVSILYCITCLLVINHPRCYPQQNQLWKMGMPISCLSEMQSSLVIRRGSVPGTPADIKTCGYLNLWIQGHLTLWAFPEPQCFIKNINRSAALVSFSWSRWVPPPWVQNPWILKSGAYLYKEGEQKVC